MTTLPHPADVPHPVSVHDVGYQSYRILQLAFVVAPIIAGIDKFTHVLVNWDQYLAPWIANMFEGNAHGFMMAVGIIEIIVGVGVALKPKIFGYVVALWMLGIIINLVSMGAYLDIALRDLGLGLAALALARLSLVYDHLSIYRMTDKRE